MKKNKLMLGDNMKSLDLIPDNSIDSVVTDPPYALNFMNKKWDAEVPSVDFWREVYRVLKPGGHVLSFGGTRTYHRMVVNIEDAGFEIRDQIMWIYGSGFPKSHNIGKAVDKLEGNDREVIGDYEVSSDFSKHNGSMMSIDNTSDGSNSSTTLNKTKGTSPYEGWGTALKPANEPICVARKPLSEKSVAENVLKWGVGGINVDGCRVGSDIVPSKGHKGDTWNKNYENLEWKYNEGRFPANIILECLCDEVIKGEKGEVKKYVNHNENVQDKDTKINNSLNGINNTNYNDKGDIHTNPMCPCYIMDGQSGILKQSGKLYIGKDSKTKFSQIKSSNVNVNYNDKGGASRFFYNAKVSKAERNMGLDDFEEKETNGSIGLHSVGGAPTKDNKRVVKNHHPTIKPINLMTYLCRLITPPNGICLDPFMGSGSTGIAAQLEGFRFVGMEMDEEYFKIAEARIDSYEKYKKFVK